MDTLEIELLDRTRENVEIYFYKTQDEEIGRMLPSANATLGQALAAYDEACLPGAASLGKSVYWKGQYGNIFPFVPSERLPMQIIQVLCGYWKRTDLSAGSALRKMAGNRRIMNYLK